MTILYTLVFSVVTAPGDESPVTPGDVAKHEAETRSLTELPTGTLAALPGFCLACDASWLSQDYPFAPCINDGSLVELAAVCREFASYARSLLKEAARRPSAQDNQLLRHAQWQPADLNNLPETEEEVCDFGVKLWLGVHAKWRAIEKIREILEGTVTHVREPGSAAKPHPARLDPLFAQMSFDEMKVGQSAEGRVAILFPLREIDSREIQIIVNVFINMWNLETIFREKGRSFVPYIIMKTERCTQIYERLLIRYRDRMERMSRQVHIALNDFNGLIGSINEDLDRIKHAYEQIPPQFKHRHIDAQALPGQVLGPATLHTLRVHR